MLHSCFKLQEAILSTPRGITRLMDMLMDREVIRIEALLLLTFLTREAEEIQKIVVFEGAFEKIFSIIKEEGGSDGGGVVQDCLELLNNLLHKSPSNQILLRETMGFEPIISALKLRGSAYNFTKQKIHLRTNCARGLMAPFGGSNHRTTLNTPQQGSPLSGKSGGPSSSMSLMNQKLTLVKARRAARESKVRRLTRPKTPNPRYGSTPPAAQANPKINNTYLLELEVIIHTNASPEVKQMIDAQREARSISPVALARASRGYCDHGNNQEATNGDNKGRVGDDNGGIEGRAEEASKLKQNKGKDIETEVNNNNEEFPPLTGNSNPPPIWSAVASTVSKKAKAVRREDGVISEAQEIALECTRGIHATGIKKMRGHGFHADKPYYLHAKHMYNLDRMKYLRVKLPIFVFTCFSIGVAVLVYAVFFQQRKITST
ncbi:hypothetical protein GIB67_013750 [Kingdonia uniflora]|uniref:Uncharacterized protein n=1 Tax=Kingdonia uniflora TaxID=39325 RepID=A0A7J7NQJ3_9MAGN|nr:hypothetical protein GIB67_013750 [Kingdonia uniflora]